MGKSSVRMMQMGGKGNKLGTEHGWCVWGGSKARVWRGHSRAGWNDSCASVRGLGHCAWCVGRCD